LTLGRVLRMIKVWYGEIWIRRIACEHPEETTMSLTPSTMLSLGTAAPDFSLKGTGGNTVSLSDFAGARGLVVAFICNHCPYVKHLRSSFADFAREYQAQGVSVVAISSNDAENYPDDSPAKMAEEVDEQGYTFPYLYDETQDVAKAYKAACTPDFYLFDSGCKLVYRGQYDGTRPGEGIPTGEDLRKACDAALAGESIPEDQQIPSMGCNIKWKPGAAPDYFA